MPEPAKTKTKQGPQRFKKGQSGNPKGRPQGSRNKVTLAIDELLDGQAEAITQKAIDAALDGDMTAIRLCLDRICPPRKERAVSCKLPAVEKPADMAQAIRDVIAEGCPCNPLMRISLGFAQYPLHPRLSNGDILKRGSRIR